MKTENQTGTSAPRHDNSSNIATAANADPDALVAQNQVPGASLADDTCSDGYFWVPKKNQGGPKKQESYLTTTKPAENATHVADHRPPQDELFGKEKSLREIRSAENLVRQRLEDLLKCGAKIKRLKIARQEYTKIATTSEEAKKTRKTQIGKQNSQISWQRKQATHLANMVKLAMYVETTPCQVAFLKKLCKNFNIDMLVEAAEPTSYYVKYRPNTTQKLADRAKNLAEVEYVQKDLDDNQKYLRFLDKLCELADQLCKELENKFANDPFEVVKTIVENLLRVALSGSEEELRKIKEEQIGFINTLSVHPDLNSCPLGKVCENYQALRQERISARASEPYEDRSIKAMLAKRKAQAALTSCLTSRGSSAALPCAEPHADGEDSIGNLDGCNNNASNLRANNKTASSEDAADVGINSDSDSDSASKPEYFWEQKNNRWSGEDKAIYLREEPEEDSEPLDITDPRGHRERLFGKKASPGSLCSAKTEIELELRKLFNCELKINSLTAEAERRRDNGAGKKELKAKHTDTTRQKRSARHAVNGVKLELYNEEHPCQVGFLEGLCQSFGVSRPSEIFKPTPKTYHVKYKPGANAGSRYRARQAAEKEWRQKILDEIEGCVECLEEACLAMDDQNEALKNKSYKGDAHEVRQSMINQVCQSVLLDSKQGFRTTVAKLKTLIDGLPTSGNSSDSPFISGCETYEALRQKRMIAKEAESYSNHRVYVMLEEYKAARARAELASPCNPSPSASSTCLATSDSAAVCVEPCTGDQGSIDNDCNQSVGSFLQANSGPASSTRLRKRPGPFDSDFFKPATQPAKIAKTEKNSTDAQPSASTSLPAPLL